MIVMLEKKGCECCRYHGTEDAYRNEPIVDNEKVHAVLLYDNEIVVWLEKDGCLSIGALIPVLYCPNCGCRL